MIEFKHVSKTYPNGVKGLKDVNLTFEQGEFVAIIGLSGAGTSTLAGAPSAAPQKKAAAASYAAVDIVEHRVFGRGKVLKATPIAGDCIVEIQFDRVGVKKTMANYAPLKKVEE